MKIECPDNYINLINSINDAESAILKSIIFEIFGTFRPTAEQLKEVTYTIINGEIEERKVYHNNTFYGGVRIDYSAFPVVVSKITK